MLESILEISFSFGQHKRPQSGLAAQLGVESLPDRVLPAFPLHAMVAVDRELVVSLRERDGPAGQVIGFASPDTKGEVVGPAQNAEGLEWQPIRLEGRKEDRWLATKHLVLVQSPSTAKPPAAPSLLTGGSSFPGAEFALTNPELRFQAPSNVDEVAIYIRLLNADGGAGPLVYDSESATVRIPGTSRSFQVPPGVLQPEKRYRWNARARNSAGWGAFAPPAYFTARAVQLFDLAPVNFERQSNTV